MPPVAPWSTSRRKAGESRCSSSALAPPSHNRAVSAPMAARNVASRTTTKTKGWLFSALGAWVAAVRIRATVVSSTSSGRNDRAARWLCTTAKKSGGFSGGVTTADGTDPMARAAPRGADWAPPKRPRYLGRCIGPGSVPAIRHGGGIDGGGGQEAEVAAGAGTQEDLLKGISGERTGKSKVVVERGTVQHFPAALFSASPIYHSPDAARQAGFDNIPAPPTRPFAMEFSGKF